MPDQRLTYKTVGDVQLSMDAFLPEPSARGGARPGIVFFHGGGWSGGDPSQFHEQCRYFASRGMVALSAEYRLIGRHGTTPCECVADGKSAVRWLRRHAAGLGLDPCRIAAGGGSAGGHVAAATAVVAGFDDEGPDDAVSAKPDALVLFNPVLDNGPGGFGHALVRDCWREFSPLHNIGPGVPPVIVFLGTEDPLFPVSTARTLRARVHEAGGRCEVWTYTGQPHGFFNYRDGDNPCYFATVCEADRFLASLGYLQGPPALPVPAVEAMRL